MDDNELEQAVRAGLERRAAAADVTVPVAARARTLVSRRRRTRWGVGAAAAAVVLVVGGIAVATSRGGDDAHEPAVTDRGSSDVRPSGVTEWRTEYWGAVAVDVPADWAYGGAPVESGGDIVACYPEAMVGPDGDRLRQSGDRGWVGRPIVVTDVCALYPWIEGSPQVESTTPYVWLGAAVEPGVVDYGNGFVEETIEVEDVTVTVASDNAALRAQILGSARPGDLCPPRLEQIPEPQLDSDGDQDGSDLTVCSYRRTDGGFTLSYGAFGQTVRPYDDTVDASRLVMYRCTVERDDEFVLLTTDRGTYVVDFTCPRLLSPDGRSHLLNSGTIQPWARNGIPAVVYGPTGGRGAMIDSFIGPLG